IEGAKNFVGDAVSGITDGLGSIFSYNDGGMIMDNKLIPLYRERESYTFFYEQQNNVLYKLQHRNKSFGLFFIFILGMTWASELISDIYANYQSSFLNIIIFISAIGITYYL